VRLAALAWQFEFAKPKPRRRPKPPPQLSARPLLPQIRFDFFSLIFVSIQINSF
jgi:hypothetical protein